MQKMLTHLFHVSWGQCVFSTVMNGKLLINWCNHHTKKKKKQWVFRQNACNRKDEIYCHVGAKSLICLPEHVSHFSTIHHLINHSIYSTNYHSQRILESWNPLKNIFQESHCKQMPNPRISFLSRASYAKHLLVGSAQLALFP